MTDNLTLSAGPRALEIIRDGGLTPDRVRVIAGAAGGPKWIVLNHLDRYIFSSWLTGLKTPVFLIGSSIATFRYAAAMQTDPVSAIETFLYEYIHQHYDDVPTPEEVTDTSRSILTAYLTDSGITDILNHPFLRFNALAVRSRHLTSSENRYIQTIGLVGAAAVNLISRKGLKLFFERTLFHDSRDMPPFYGMNQFPISRAPVTRDNIREIILASGSIPLVMSGIQDIPGTGGGTFRDGGVIDYHLDIPFGVNNDIVLYPHYTDRIIPGWLDKSLPWREPDRRNMENVLLVAPSREFISKLPFGKIPDRNDFRLFQHRDSERIHYWTEVAEKSRILADDFQEAIESGTITTLVKPM